jgi:WXG100 family type VII secretion target
MYVRKLEVAKSMKINIEDIQTTAAEFKKASEDTEDMIVRLQQAVKKLEESWEDAGQQTFYKYYQEWHTHISGFSQLLEVIGTELDAIAARYMEADGDI